jgi:hypothetical protein
MSVSGAGVISGESVLGPRRSPTSVPMISAHRLHHSFSEAILLFPSSFIAQTTHTTGPVSYMSIKEGAGTSH